MNSMKDFKEAQADQIIKMDAEATVETGTPLVARLQKRVLELDRSVDHIRKLAMDMPELSGLCASATRTIDAMRMKTTAAIEKLARTDDVKRTYPVKCHICGIDNYFSRKEFFNADGTPCRNCNNPL